MNTPKRITRTDLPPNIRQERSGRFAAQLTHKGKPYYLGVFDTVEEAQARIELFRKEHPKTRGKKIWQPGDPLK